MGGTSPHVWLLVSEPGKSGLAGIFDTFWYGTEDFWESGPEIEIPGRDLAFGRGQVLEGVQIWDIQAEISIQAEFFLEDSWNIWPHWVRYSKCSGFEAQTGNFRARSR